MKKFFLLFFLFVFTSKTFPFPYWLVLGDHEVWQFRKVGDEKWYPATVPGTVHTDLLKNKIIPDPYLRNNEKKLQWIENEEWEYKLEFDITDIIYECRNIQIEFKGLDTYADVYLNGSLIIRADNMFRTWKVNIKPLVERGQNELYILFRSPIKISDSLKKNNVPLPGDNYSRVRKAAYHFGWDWGPRFVTCGIWKEVRITAFDDLCIENLTHKILSINNNSAEVEFTANIFTGYRQPYRYYLGLWGDSEKLYRSSFMGKKNGETKLSFKINIENVQLWWCNGLGEPYIYQFNLEVNREGKEIDNKKISIGIRTIELVKEKDNAGESFYFKLNGVPLFIKGANYIPTDNFLAISMWRFNNMQIEAAVKSNFNMLRIWGGGIYEEDYFYDCCDKRGILVWQDFMFACAMYPGDSSFINNVRQEAIDNIQRLNNHPCIALWCGNNEIDEGWHNWGWQKQFGYSQEDSTKIWNDYLKLFHDVLPSVVNEYSVMKNYIPSSPKIGWGHPESMTEGDSHYWGVWWGMEPFDIYKTKIPRFMSEFGFQGFPDLKTIESFTQPEDRYLYSDVMKSHQKHPTGYETIQKYLEREYNQPKDFESYVYVSQLLQAYGIKTAIEAQRRAKPYCMGTLYWQLNDCWPVVSWSGIDYYGRWKALQYFVKDAYKDVLVSINKEDDSIKIYIVNDRLETVEGKLEIELENFDGVDYPILSNGQLIPPKKIFLAFQETVPKNSSKLCLSIDIDKFLESRIANELVLIVKFKDYQGNEYKNLYYFVPAKDLALINPELTYRYDSKTGDLSIKTEKLAKNVYVSVVGRNEFFTMKNNYFDMLPGEEIRLNIGHPSVYKIKDIKNIKIKTLFDTY